MVYVEPCFFLHKIPGEMRNRIYDYALLGKNGAMTLRSSGMIVSSRRRGGDGQESKAMTELQVLEEFIDATEPILKEEQSIIDRKKQRVKELEVGLQRLLRTVRAKVSKSRELGQLTDEISALEDEVDEMSTKIQTAKRDARVIRTDYLLGSREGESPVFRDMQNLFALSRTCKQIREECSGLVYEFNKVKFMVDTETHRTKNGRRQVLHKQLQYILKRQLELAELKTGLIIDFGFVPGATTTVAFFDFNLTIQEYQGRLRNLKKASPSMEIHFQVSVASQQHPCLEKVVSWELMLDTPESVVAQYDAQLAAERQWLHQPDVEYAKGVLVKIFWPLWAVQNLL
ncbi:hypothetical protein AC579_2680 [Pseudocercospora musae]|uniref:Uncharacterized protein n=1 Tax=Pseudocercospora musae TaxID=113226 RepID=A0A139IVK1_9PEZI|nr:hypothetical protein AC579_2680 [Pseudocercospora musae]